MTLSHRIGIAFVTLLAAVGLLIGVGWLSYQNARADGPHYVVTGQPKPVELAQVETPPMDAGLAPAAATAPADKLHDPIAAPGAAWDEVKAAKKVGWPLAVFAGLIMLCKLLARAKKLPMLAMLGKGKVAVVIGALGALGAACYNAAAEGGAWTAMLSTGLVALAHYMDAGSKAES